MFEFIGNFFKNRPEKAAPSASPAPQIIPPKSATTIKYDPNLMQELESDHSKLVNLYSRIWSEGYEKKDFAAMSRLIAQFKSDFQAHLLTENVKFYVYLEQTLANDKHNLNIVKEFRTDMNDIANAVVKFCKTYQGDLTPELVVKFKSDYTAVGEVLTRRVSLEEKSLYVLYQPN
ncbi:hemerythrin domain-containing protein [Aliikangiella sp. IMCC44653]